jgi:hypothetical protein
VQIQIHTYICSTYTRHANREKPAKPISSHETKDEREEPITVYKTEITNYFSRIDVTRRKALYMKQKEKMQEILGQFTSHLYIQMPIALHKESS